MKDISRVSLKKKQEALLQLWPRGLTAKHNLKSNNGSAHKSLESFTIKFNEMSYEVL